MTGSEGEGRLYIQRRQEQQGFPDYGERLAPRRFQFLCLSDGERDRIKDVSVFVQDGQLVIAPLWFPEQLMG